MKKIIVTKISVLGEYITIGLFKEDGGESNMQLTLSAKLFPEGIKMGDEVVFIKKPKALDVLGE